MVVEIWQCENHASRIENFQKMWDMVPFANLVTTWVASTASTLLYKNKSSTVHTTTVSNLNILARQRKKRKKEKHSADFLDRYFCDAFSCHWTCCWSWRWINVLTEVYMLPFLRFWEFLFVLYTISYVSVLSLHIKSINLMICTKEVHLMYIHISNSFSIKASTHGVQIKQYQV